VKRASWICRAALAVVALVATPATLSAQETPATTQTATAQSDLQQISAALNDPSPAQQPQRDEAARKLVSRQSEEARQILRAALLNEANHAAQLAAARALAFDPSPDDRLIDQLFALLGPDKPLSDAASAALASYHSNTQVLIRLIAVSTDEGKDSKARAAALRALGFFPDKTAARTLIDNLLARPNENPTTRGFLRDSACDALIEMTGQRELGHDVRRWQQWWAFWVDKPDNEFSLQLLLSRASRLDQLQHRYNQLVLELGKMIREQSDAVPAELKSDFVLRYLRSSESVIRYVGVAKIHNDVAEDRAVAASLRDYLPKMVGDSASEVRLEVARTLKLLNNAAALEPLLGQLAVESEPEVRGAIAAALSPISKLRGDLRALAPLRNLLQDPSADVVKEAAQSLRDLSSLIRQKQPEAASELAGEFNILLNTRTAPGSSGLREAIVEAMGALRQADLLPAFGLLLRAVETPSVRRSALRAMGELADPKAAEIIIANALNDADSGVRFEAVDALGKCASFAHAELLYKRLDPHVELDRDVRQRAGQVLDSLFPGATKDQLEPWVDRFHSDFDRRLIMLQAYGQKLVQPNDVERLAGTRQNIGEVLMKLERPGEAAPYFRLALDYWKEKGGQMVTEGLRRQLMDALLKSREYAKAVEFAQQNIATEPSLQQTMGSMLRTEVDRLYLTENLVGAQALIDEVKNMKPALDERYLNAIRQIEDNIKTRSPGKRPTTTRGK
jgi:HEAT repeat protein